MRILVLLAVCLVCVNALKGKRRTRVIRQSGSGGGCLYDGKVYQQGQTWQVPCKYDCTCQDGVAGKYQCTEVCPHYDNLPQGCFMVQVPDSCCSKPQCNFQTSGGGTTGMGTQGSGQGGSVVIQTSGGAGQMQTATCVDTLNNCKDYDASTCTNPDYAGWVKDNCAKTCNKCGYSSGTSMQTGGSSMGQPGGSTGGGDGGFHLVMNPGTSGSSSCTDKIQNCAAYTQTVCNDQQYNQWVLQNCPAFCNKCGGGSMTGTGTGGYPMTGTGTGTYPNTGTGTGGYPNTGTGTGTYPNTGTGSGTYPMTGTGTGTYPNTGTGSGTYPNTGTGSGTYPMTGTGTGTHPNTGTGSGTYPNTGTGTGTYPMTGTGTGTYPNTGTGSGTYPNTGTGSGTYPNTGTGSCADRISNCAAYGQNVCSDATYAGWVKDNCAKTCNKCSGGTMTSGTNAGSGYYGPGGSGISSMTGTGTGSSGVVTGHSNGCAYKGQVYQQGQTWKDGCDYRCTCTDGSQGRYSCQQLCVQWDNLPSVCQMNPPAAGKCCRTPQCPSYVQLHYPDNYTPE